MFNFDQVTAFITTVEAGSISAAARKLGKSQSTISNAVNNFEIELGGKLLDRSNNPPILTRLGQTIYSQAGLLLKQANMMSALANSALADEELQLDIGLDNTLSMGLISDSLTRISELYPLVKINIIRGSRNELGQQLLNSSINLLLGTLMKGVPETLEFTTVASLKYVMACSADSELAAMENIDNLTLFSYRQICCSSHLNNAVEDGKAVTMQGMCALSDRVWSASNLDDLTRIVEGGMGWAWMPYSIAKEKEEQEKLKIFHPRFEKTESHIQVELLTNPQIERGPILTTLIELLSNLEAQ